MRYLVIIAAAIASALACVADPVSPVGSSDPSVGDRLEFYGFVFEENGAPVDGAIVEWSCNTCGYLIGRDESRWGGYYEIRDLAAVSPVEHDEHCVTGVAGKEGYLGQGIQMLGCGPAPRRVDFHLIPERSQPLPLAR